MKQKYSLDTMLAILKDDQAKGVPMGNTYLSGLANQSGWLAKSIELMIESGMVDDEQEVRSTAEDNVSEYYARRELEDRDYSRSASGYNSAGEIVELDFN